MYYELGFIRQFGTDPNKPVEAFHAQRLTPIGLTTFATFDSFNVGVSEKRIEQERGRAFKSLQDQVWSDLRGIIRPRGISERELESFETPILVNAGETICPYLADNTSSGQTFFVSGLLVDAP